MNAIRPSSSKIVHLSWKSNGTRIICLQNRKSRITLWCHVSMSASVAANVKSLEVCYFERQNLVGIKKLLKTPRLILRKKTDLIFRQDKLKVTSNAFVFEVKLDHQRHPCWLNSVTVWRKCICITSRLCLSEFRPPIMVIIWYFEWGLFS